MKTLTTVLLALALAAPAGASDSGFRLGSFVQQGETVEVLHGHFASFTLLTIAGAEPVFVDGVRLDVEPGECIRIRGVATVSENGAVHRFAEPDGVTPCTDRDASQLLMVRADHVRGPRDVEPEAPQEHR